MSSLLPEAVSLNPHLHPECGTRAQSRHKPISTMALGFAQHQARVSGGSPASRQPPIRQPPAQSPASPVFCAAAFALPFFFPPSAPATGRVTVHHLSFRLSPSSAPSAQTSPGCLLELYPIHFAALSLLTRDNRMNNFLAHLGSAFLFSIAVRLRYLDAGRQ